MKRLASAPGVENEDPISGNIKVPQKMKQSSYPARFRGSASGFTLMELIVVTTILATMSMAVYPAFHGALDSIKREGAIDNLVATLQFAQSSAINEGVEYRVYLDPDSNSFWIARRELTQTDEGRITPVLIVSGDVQVLPSDLRFERLKARRDRSFENAYYVSFYPSGARDEALIPITVDGKRYKGYELSTKGKITRIDVKEK